MTYELHRGDCLEVMRDIPDGSIDCVITDPPYGTTACKWDSVIPFEPMWRELKRIAKPKAAICLFGSQPFTSALVMSNPTDFKYEWVWDKGATTGFLDAKRKPLRRHEGVLTFYREQPTYRPQMTKGPRHRNGAFKHNEVKTSVYAAHSAAGVHYTDQYYPTSVIAGMRRDAQWMKVHPTQKPVDLIRYLVRTYTLENETVLDFTMGSGTTGVACQLENRNFIGIEKDQTYFEIARKRIEEAAHKEPLFV